MKSAVSILSVFVFLAAFLPTSAEARRGRGRTCTNCAVVSQPTACSSCSVNSSPGCSSCGVVSSPGCSSCGEVIVNPVQQGISPAPAAGAEGVFAAAPIPGVNRPTTARTGGSQTLALTSPTGGSHAGSAWRPQTFVQNGAIRMRPRAGVAGNVAIVTDDSGFRVFGDGTMYWVDSNRVLHPVTIRENGTIDGLPQNAQWAQRIQASASQFLGRNVAAAGGSMQVAPVPQTMKPAPAVIDADSDRMASTREDDSEDSDEGSEDEPAPKKAKKQSAIVKPHLDEIAVTNQYISKQLKTTPAKFFKFFDDLKDFKKIQAAIAEAAAQDENFCKGCIWLQLYENRNKLKTTKARIRFVEDSVSKDSGEEEVATQRRTTQTSNAETSRTGQALQQARQRVLTLLQESLYARGNSIETHTRMIAGLTLDEANYLYDTAMNSSYQCKGCAVGIHGMDWIREFRESQGLTER